MRAGRTASATPLPPEDQQEIDALLGAGVVGEALPSRPIADPSVYFPLSERTHNYLVTGGPKAGATQPLGLSRGKRPDGNPAWRLGLSPSQAAFLRKTDGGDLHAGGHRLRRGGRGDHARQSVRAQGMQPGESRTLSQQVAVNYLDDPTSRDYWVR